MAGAVGAVEAVAVSADRACYLGTKRKNLWDLFSFEAKSTNSCAEAPDPTKPQPSRIAKQIDQKNQMAAASRDLMDASGAKLPPGIDNRPKSPQAEALKQREEAKEGQMALGDYNKAFQNMQREKEAKKKPDIKMGEIAQPTGMA